MNRVKIKKLISILIIQILIIIPGISLANNDCFSGEEYMLVTEVNLSDLDNVRRLSFEEAVEKRMTSEGLSYNEALEVMVKEEEAILLDFAEKEFELKYKNKVLLTDKEKVITEIINSIEKSNIINYVSVEQTFEYAKNRSYKAKLEAELRIVQDTSTTYIIDRVMGLTSRRVSGLYTYTWNQTASDYDLAVGKKSVYMWVKGYFEVQIDTSVSGGLSIPGFSLEASYGTINYYQSDTVMGTKTYTVR